LETLEPWSLSTDLGPYSLVASALSGLLTKVELTATAAGGATGTGYELSLSGPNASIPWTAVDGVRATFSGNVTVAANDLSLYTGSQQTTSGFTRVYDAATDTTTAYCPSPA
jgi:hypothetical protein